MSAAAKICITCEKPLPIGYRGKTHSAADDPDCRRQYDSQRQVKWRKDEALRTCKERGHDVGWGLCGRCGKPCERIRGEREIRAIRTGWKTRQKGDENPVGLPTADALAVSEESRRNARKLTKEERAWLNLGTRDRGVDWITDDELETYWELRPVTEDDDVRETVVNKHWNMMGFSSPGEMERGLQIAERAKRGDLRAQVALKRMDELGIDVAYAELIGAGVDLAVAA